MLVNLKLTKPQFILGILNASYAQGNFSAPLLDPAWATPGTNFLIGDLICNGCGKEFTPKYRGQLYCSNVCALKVLSTEEKANVAKAHETRRQNTLASEQGFQTGE